EMMLFAQEEPDQYEIDWHADAEYRDECPLLRHSGEEEPL
ncbi:hypothetical protein EVA_10880, partial [gut metagenome]